MNKKAFTLAEVLITLGIIGIIAAMTIPTILSNTDKQANAIKLKKFYSTFNQALLSYTTDAGTPGDLKATNIFTNSSDAQNLIIGNELIKYIKTAKNCLTAADGKCFPTKIFYLNAQSSSDYSIIGADVGYKFITADGSSVIIQSISNASSCDNNWYGATPGIGTLKSICGRVYVDVNGFKAPNRYGKDTFVFVISNAGILVPYGSHLFSGTGYQWDGPGKTYNCYKTSDVSVIGLGCAGRIMDESWEMNY